MSSDNSTQPIPSSEIIYRRLGFIQNPDGSLTRIPDFLPALPDPGNSIPVLTKDIHINEANNTFARIYLPQPKPESKPEPKNKYPVIVYYHGGGFILCSPATSIFQKFCSDLANEIPAVIVSIGYRLAPEHRLPAAYDDGVAALKSIAASGDDCLSNHADFTNCVLMGSSAGGNLAYHVGLRAVTSDLRGITIRGLILHQPFFGGVRRTSSEIRLAEDKMLPPFEADLMWEMALPVGADRDHEYCNPMVGVELGVLGKMKDRRWKVLVTGCDGDALVDRQIEFVKMLRDEGVDVVGEFSEGGFHGLELFEEDKGKVMCGVVKDFILSL